MDEKSLSNSIPPIETFEESIVDYNILFDMFYNDYPESAGRDKILNYENITWVDLLTDDKYNEF